MEATDNSKNKQRRLLFHQWQLNRNGYQNRVAFKWRGKEIFINIVAECDPPGRDVNVSFHFHINGMQSHYQYCYNCYGAGPNGNIPEVLSEGHKLIISAKPFTLEILEELIEQVEKQPALRGQPERKMKLRPTDGQDHSKEPESTHHIQKEIWISVKNISLRSDQCSPFDKASFQIWSVS